MATKKTEEPVDVIDTYDPEEKVDFMIPMASPEDRPLVLGVNGEFISVKPGVTVQVKRKFVEVYEHSMKQKQAAMQARVNAQNASRRALADL